MERTKALGWAAVIIESLKGDIREKGYVSDRHSAELVEH